MQLRQLAVAQVACAAGLWMIVGLCTGAAGEPVPPTPTPAESATPGEKPGEGQAVALSTAQDLVARRYKRFEETLKKISQTLGKTDPDRAALLMRAIGQSNREGISRQMAELVELLKQDQLGDAVERQGELVTQLMSLLDLLSSEDRKQENAAERARIEKHLKTLNRLIAEEKDLRAATERGEPGDGLAGRQKKVAQKTDDLRRELDREDAEKSSRDKPGEKNTGNGEPQDGQPGAKPDGEKPAGEKQPGGEKPGESEPQEGQPGEAGEPAKGSPSQGKPGESGPPDKSQQTPGRDNIEKARREMEQAHEKLKQSERNGASDHQDEALRELAKAKEKFEEILRQLREEERDRVLAALEARFQRMLQAQLAVYDGTARLDKTPLADRESRHSAKSVQLARQEEEIAIEATKALTLLREEGSAVAFPEAVEQMRDDMRIVSGNLERADVGDLTQSIEKDIIAALEEMIESLQKEMEKKDDKPPPNSQQQPQADEQALVDQLSELKMLRSLQLRVNHRTKRLGRLIEGEQARQPNIISQLHNLAERQARIQQATYDLAAGKNKTEDK